MATQRIRRFDPIQVAKVMGVLYGLIGLLFAPIFIIISMVAPEGGGLGAGIGIAIILPIVYAVLGAIGTVIAAALYNVVAGWVGGIEVEVE